MLHIAGGYGAASRYARAVFHFVLRALDGGAFEVLKFGLVWKLERLCNWKMETQLLVDQYLKSKSSLVLACQDASETGQLGEHLDTVSSAAPCIVEISLLNEPEISDISEHDSVQLVGEEAGDAAWLPCASADELNCNALCVDVITSAHDGPTLNNVLVSIAESENKLFSTNVLTTANSVLSLCKMSQQFPAGPFVHHIMLCENIHVCPDQEAMNKHRAKNRRHCTVLSMGCMAKCLRF